MSGVKQLLSIFVACLFVAPSGAKAADGDRDIKNRNKLALKAASNGKFKEAASIWEDLLDEVPKATALGIRANLAVAYRELGQLPSAWHHLTWYLKNSGKTDRTAGKELQLLEKDLAEAGFVRTAVACEPSDATVHLGKTTRAKKFPCPLAWWIKPGKLWVTVAAKGYETRTVELDVRKRGDQTAHNVRLSKVAASKGELVVDGKGRAIQVFLDGALEGTVPFRRKLNPGDYELMVGKPGKMPWKKKITIVAGKTLVERPPLAQPVPEPTKVVEPDPTKLPGKTITETESVERSSRAWKWALLGSGVAVVAGGGVMSYLAADAYNEAKTKYMVPYNALTPAEKDVQYFGIRADFEDDVAANVQPKLVSSYIMYGIGGAAAAAGVALLAWDVISEEPAAVSLVPTLDSNHGGFALSYSF